MIGPRADLLCSLSSCTALLYNPFSSLLGNDTTTPISVLDLSYPILDLTPVTASSTTSFHVSLDTSRGTTPSTEAASLVCVSLASHVLALDTETSASSSAIAQAATSSTDKLPNVASLYPVLSLLHHPDQSFEEGGDAGEGGEAGKGRGKGRKELKRSAEGSPAREVGEARKTGKRAAGRAEIKRRLEEQRVIQEGGGVVPEGEKVTEEEKMEALEARGGVM